MVLALSYLDRDGAVFVIESPTFDKHTLLISACADLVFWSALLRKGLCGCLALAEIPKFDAGR